jgi:hypothetical protein
MKYPLFVLNYVGDKPSEIPNLEITWGLNNVESEIQALKARFIRDLAGIP